MGKDLRGRELGVGICQRKDKRYTARKTDLNGKRFEKCFTDLNDAKRWLLDCEIDNGESEKTKVIKFKDWFNIWKSDVLTNTVSEGSLDIYSTRIMVSAMPILGNMEMDKIKPINCQKVLNRDVENGMSTTTISMTRTAMKLLFDSAVYNDIIPKSPITKSVKAVSFKEEKKKVLTVQEQKKFVEYMEQCIMYGDDGKESVYLFFLLALQTGMRCGELMGLKWEDIDYESHAINVRRAMKLHGTNVSDYDLGTPKTDNAIRRIPLTDSAIEILSRVKKVKSCFNKHEGLIFLNNEGLPWHKETYHVTLKKSFKNINVEGVSTHGLRHTFATRCIESGMKPKTLSEIMGHSSVAITLDMYVHSSEEDMLESMKNMEKFVC